MGKAEWGVDPGFFGPRHAHREDRIVRALSTFGKPGLHLECAAGVGSLSLRLAGLGHRVVAVDSSLRSLAVVSRRAELAGSTDHIVQVLADITHLPFAEGAFSSASSAETLEHVEAHEDAVAEVARVLEVGGWFVGTVPAGPDQWSDWDDWAGHIRRYTQTEMETLLDTAGFDNEVRVWGWPMLRLYDSIFLSRVNRRRQLGSRSVDEDPDLKRIAWFGKKRWLIATVRAILSVDRLFDGCRWGVGILFAARKTG